MNLSDTLGLSTAPLVLLVYYLYLRQTRRGDSDPNPATWLIWLVVGIAHTVTYFFTVDKDWYKISFAIAVNICVLLFFIYSKRNNKLSPITIHEIDALVLAGATGTLWLFSGDEIIANITFQLVYIISFVPTVKNVITGESKEKSPPWIISVFVYFVQIAALATSEEPQGIVPYLHPIINGVLGNGSVAITTIIKNRKNR